MSVFIAGDFAGRAEVINHLKTHNEPAVMWVADAMAVEIAHAFQLPFYLGGAYPAWTGAGTRYFEGMMSDEWRWSNIVANVEAVRYILDATDAEPAGWYLTEENDLSALAANPALAARMSWYLIELMRQLYHLRPLPFIWSPWGSLNVTTNKLKGARDTIILARDWLRSWGLPVEVELHFQDGVGAGHHTVTGAIGWGKALKTLPIPTFMNMELYTRKTVGGVTTLVPGDRAEIIARENMYRSAGLAIGAKWEGRYWWYEAWVANHAGH